MRTFLEVKGKLGPIPQSSNQYRPSQPDTNPNVRKPTKTTEKRKRVAPTKRFKANIAMKLNADGATTQPPVAISKAPTNFKIQAPSQEGTPENRPLPLEDVPICTCTPWPKGGKMLGNLFKARKDWLLPPNYIDDDTNSTANITSPKPPIKVEPKTEGQPSTSPKAEKCGWGPNCPFCKNKEDWDGDHQKQLQQQLQPQQKIQMTQVQHPQTLSYQKPQSFQRFDQKTPDGWYPSQL